MSNLIYRYPGPYPFEEAQANLFFGREREAKELFYMIAAERLVVLFAKSGIGKTSLLQAGVTPKLRQANIDPITIRFNDTSKSPLQIFKDTFCEKTNQNVDNQDITLWELLKNTKLTQHDEAQTPLLVLDQFEELFTLNFDLAARLEFFNELAYLVSGDMPKSVFKRIAKNRHAYSDEQMRDYEKPPLLKIVIALRSDMLHYLDEISMPIPSILRNRYQLLALKNDAAREAIEKPAAAEGTHFKIAERFGFTPYAMNDMMQVLSKDNEVESFQLQLVCRGIEEKILKGKRSKYDAFHLAETNENGLKQLNSDFFGGQEGIKTFIENFYREVLAKLDDTEIEEQVTGQKVSPSEKFRGAKIIENQLLTESGRRRSVDKETLMENGATTEILAHFEQERLLRKEPRMNTFYYELSHDTLVEPILKVKKERLEREEKERLAQERIAAEAKAREEEAKRKAAERQRRNARLLAMSAVVGLCVAVMAAFYAWRQTEKAEQATKEANAQKDIAEKSLLKAYQSDIKRLEETAKKYDNDLISLQNQKAEVDIIRSTKKGIIEVHNNIDSINMLIKKIIK